MRKLHIDIETFSEVNLKTAGLYKYAASCEVLMVAYSYHNPTGPTPVKLFDLSLEDLPEYFIKDLQNPNIIKYAHNAAFEIACLSAWLDIELDPSQWRCSMAVCAMAALPLSLDQASSVLGVDQTKDKIGTALINYFCKPCKPTKANGQRVRNLPYLAPEKWAQFCEYCKQDVRTEMAITEALQFIHIPQLERDVWTLDQRINARGVKTDIRLIKNAIRLDTDYKEILVAEAIKITGLDNPNSVKALKKWLEEETETEIANLQKKEIPKLIEKFDSKIVKRVLTIREELSKTSVTKYATMLRAGLDDHRIRGMFQYAGAGRTLRFAGRLVQLHNIVKGKYAGEDLNRARQILSEGDADLLELLYGSIPNTLSQLIRTALIPKKGCRFIVSDFSAIEAVIIAWLADERWRLEVFRTHGKIYEASAAQMFNVPIESVTKGSELRAKSKVAELALGYAGGVNALIKMGALEEGLKEHELQPLVDAWRATSPNIKQLWYDVDRAAKKAIHTGETVVIQKGISFSYRRKYLIIGLPSGHNLYYFDARLVPGERGVQIQYLGMDQVKKKWVRQRTYGGKLVENLCQAIGRDCLVNGMLNLDKAGYEICLHVHDEVVVEVPIGEGSAEEVNELLCKPAPWMKGLPLRSAGFETEFYKKD